ncbi:MAG: OmpA family protein [Deltaproteobacteria bacterium]|nr:OmpA family protein [Deltaproteobacteria bacterium]
MLKCFRLMIALFLMVLAPMPVRAGGKDINIRLFEPSTDEFGSFSVVGSSVLRSFEPIFGFSLDFARNPLILVAGRSAKREIVSATLGADLYAGIGLFDLMQVTITLPVALYTGGNGIEPGDDLSIGGLSDTRLLVKWKIVDRKKNPVGFGFENALEFPTAVPRNSFQGGSDQGVMYEPRLVLDSKLGPALLAANLGYRTRPTSKLLGLRIGDEWFYSGAAVFSVLKDFDLLGEIFGSTTAHAPFGSHEVENTLEGVLGARYRPGPGITFRAGMGFGLLPGYGCPKYRVIFGMSWTPPEEKQVKTLPPPLTKGKTKTKVIVVERKPVPKPKVKPMDSDKDGILDDQDKCPNDPEDKDNFEDEDGCPDNDNDRDGILDKDDKCPNDPEDKDNFEDEDGCPDNDNDRDGILDKDDKCPNRPETINGVRDNDGCPDKGAVKVVITKERIEIKEKIYFARNRAKIRRRSHSILNQVALVLKAHPEIKKIRIEGHTDNSGKRSWNLKLSKWRAAEVMKYLAKRGVQPDRMEAVGFGPDKPIASNRTRRGRAANRRVEFRILENEPSQMEIPALVPVAPLPKDKKGGK